MSVSCSELNPESLTVLSNQVSSKSDSVLRDSGVAFGPSALLRAEFDKIVFEVSIQTPVTVRTEVLRRHIKNLSISELLRQ